MTQRALASPALVTSQATSLARASLARARTPAPSNSELPSLDTSFHPLDSASLSLSEENFSGESGRGFSSKSGRLGKVLASYALGLISTVGFSGCQGTQPNDFGSFSAPPEGDSLPQVTGAFSPGSGARSFVSASALGDMFGVPRPSRTPLPIEPEQGWLGEARDAFTDALTRPITKIERLLENPERISEMAGEAVIKALVREARKGYEQGLLDDPNYRGTFPPDLGFSDGVERFDLLADNRLGGNGSYTDDYRYAPFKFRHRDFRIGIGHDLLDLNGDGAPQSTRIRFDLDLPSGGDAVRALRGERSFSDLLEKIGAKVKLELNPYNSFVVEGESGSLMIGGHHIF